MARFTHIWKIGVVVTALLATVVACGNSDSSRARNAALVAGKACVKPGAVSKISKVSVVCAKTTTGNIWYATMKAKGKAQACAKPGTIRKKSQIVWVCGVVKKKKLWQATQPLTALAVKGGLLSTSLGASVVADNAVLADPKIPDDKIVTQVPDAAATPTLAPAVPAALSLATQPSGGVNAVALETQPVVQLLDQRGASISTAGITITAVSGRTDVALSGNTVVTDATGRATFKTLSLKGIMGDITLTFTTAGLEGITSGKFVLAAGVATNLVNSAAIGSVASGKAFDQQPVLHLEDSSANVIAVSGVDVIVTSSPPGLIGTTTVATNKNGVAEFTGLALTQAGKTILTFTSGALSTKPEVTVVAGDYTTVKITKEASVVATNNTAFSQSPVVQLIDANDNNVATKGITVTATITQFPTADTATLLIATATATTDDQGQATFTGLGITGLIGDYALGYTPRNGVTQASEKTTTLSAGVETQLTVLTAAAGPEGNSTAGTWSLTQSPVIGLRDISNNLVKTNGVTVTATVAGQAPTTAQTDNQGEAKIVLIFNGDSAGDRTITYSALSLGTKTATIGLPLLTTVVSPAWVLQKRIKSSAPFILTPPTSKSSGAWSYAGSPTTFATVNPTGQVTLTGVAGTTTITATQKEATKYASVSTTANLVTTDGYNAGDTGPGGGIVFYDAGAMQSWGRYLEAAITNGTIPSTWTPATTAEWGCNDIGVMTLVQRTASLEIGTGRANTKIITDQNCVDQDGNPSAASIAKTYNGGGKTDWFLPSGDELNELCKYADTRTTGAIQTDCIASGTIRTGFASGPDYWRSYWSSSESDANNAWRQYFNSGARGAIDKYGAGYVRPVRAFSPTCAMGGACIVGDTGPGGGEVFYKDLSRAAGSQYFEVACAGWSDGQCGYKDGDYLGDPAWPWGCNETEISGAGGLEIGTGEQNTNDIVAGCSENSPASFAYNLDLGGQTDWFLPSREELNELCKKYSNGRTDTIADQSYQFGCTGNASPAGGFAAGIDVRYWSSSQSGGSTAWIYKFDRGSRWSVSKEWPWRNTRVRPVRAFSPTTPAATAAPISFNVGDTGPGGGIVFYDAGTTQSWGRYLEAAVTNGTTPSTWTPTTTAQWGCNGTDVMTPVQRIASIEIGTGKANTKIITDKNCVDTVGKPSAASIAKAYNGGGKTDWFLPSKDELNALCKWAFNDTVNGICNNNGNGGLKKQNGGFASGSYWSSSEAGATTQSTTDNKIVTTYRAWLQDFTDGFHFNYNKSDTYYVRPVRAF